MTYSFTKPRSKSLIQRDTKFWTAFLVVSVAVLIALQLSLSVKSKTVAQEIKDMRAEKESLVKKTEAIREDLELLKVHVAYASKVSNDNAILKDSLKNLFEIVPDKITLNRVEITPTTLTLFGVTPSRDIFNLQFAPALKSIFTKSETSFIRADGGNSRFISINQIEQKIEESDVGQAVTGHEEQKDAHADKAHEAPKGGH